MGLTIHYSFKTDTDSSQAATQLLQELHSFACTLPFSQVNSIVELEENELLNTDATAPLFSLKIHAIKTIILEGEIQQIRPTTLIGFTIYTTLGCEQLDIFLCRYPDSKIWESQSFCKTQFAALEQSGGILNFIKIHTSIISLLDQANQLGILEEVIDESGYWQHRDLKQLIETLKTWLNLTESTQEILALIYRNSLFNYLN